VAAFDIKLDKRNWNEFVRQTKAAADGTPDDVQHMWPRILGPMRREWARRLPGSLKKTAKVRKKAQGEIWAGYPKPATDRPFLPWLEFGGTIKWKANPTNAFERVPLPFGFRMRKVMYLRRARVPEGRYRGPAVEGKTDDIAREFADEVQRMFNKYFGKGTFRV
jgi:hypothetical protein